MKNPTILFFGTPEFAVPSLQTLLDHGIQPIVVTAPDKPRGRKKELTSSPVKAVAEVAHCTILTPENLDDLQPIMEGLKPDVAVIVAYGKIIPEKLLSIPKFGFVNIHPSVLPKYRGPSPIQTAILNGERQTGVSLMVIDEKIDHGPVIAVEHYDIPDTAHYSEVARELSQLGADLLLRILPEYLSGALKPIPQDDSRATTTKKFDREDGKIVWSKPAEIIFNQIRALASEPGVWTTWNGKVLKIVKAELYHAPPRSESPGSVVSIDGAIAVRTGSHYLRLDHVQLEGSRAMKINDFLAGHPNFIGSTLS